VSSPTEAPTASKPSKQNARDQTARKQRKQRKHRRQRQAQRRATLILSAKEVSNDSGGTAGGSIRGVGERVREIIAILAGHGIDADVRVTLRRNQANR